MEYVNPVLLLVVVSEVCLGICAWRSPGFLRRVAAHLLARADVMDISEREHNLRMKYWRKRLDVEVEPESTTRRFPAEGLSRQEMKAS